MARMTIASTNARIDALAGDVAEIKALLLAQVSDATPAKVTPAKKAASAKRVTPKAAAPTKGTQTRETLSRKDWNRTLTAKARLAGGDTYKRVLAAWDVAQDLRDREGMTPDQALAYVLEAALRAL